MGNAIVLQSSLPFGILKRRVQKQDVVWIVVARLVARVKLRLK